MLTAEAGATVGRVDGALIGTADAGVPVVVDATGAFEGVAEAAM